MAQRLNSTLQHTLLLAINVRAGQARAIAAIRLIQCQAIRWKWEKSVSERRFTGLRVRMTAGDQEGNESGRAESEVLLGSACAWTMRHVARKLMARPLSHVRTQAYCARNCARFVIMKLAAVLVQRSARCVNKIKHDCTHRRKAPG